MKVDIKWLKFYIAKTILLKNIATYTDDANGQLEDYCHKSKFWVVFSQKLYVIYSINKPFMWISGEIIICVIAAREKLILLQSITKTMSSSVREFKIKNP